MGLNKSARLAVFKLVATVLFLGNISFGETASETAFVEENGMAERAAALPGSDPEGLKAAPITKTVEAAGESIPVPYTNLTLPTIFIGCHSFGCMAIQSRLPTTEKHTQSTALD